MISTSNILDPIAKKLDPNIYVDGRLRASVSKFVKTTVNEVFKKHFGFDTSKYLHFYLSGSLTTYQYHETSDFDLNIFIDYNKWPGKPDPGELRKQIIHLTSAKIDGKCIPKTKHPLQVFTFPQEIEPRDKYDVGMRSAWSFDKKEWVVKPEKDRVINVIEDLSPIYEKAMRTAEKLRLLLDQNPEEAKKFYTRLHKKRMEEEDLYGDFSEANIIYKFVDSEGLFDKLKALDVKIAQIIEAAWKDIEQKAKRYIEEGRFSDLINNDLSEQMGRPWFYASATVNGDTGIWNPEIWKDDAYSRAITRWACSCPWGQNSWGRTRHWIKYEGRPCAHILGLHWLTQGTPKDYKQNLDDLIRNMKMEDIPPTPPDTPKEDLPLQNGDIITVKPQVTIDAWDPNDLENRIQIPQNTVGQILEQISPSLVRVMFPNPTGWYLENKMWEAIENPDKFYRAEDARDPFVKKRTNVIIWEDFT